MIPNLKTMSPSGWQTYLHSQKHFNILHSSEQNALSLLYAASQGAYTPKTPQQKADLLDLEGEILMKQGRYAAALLKFQEALKLRQSEGYAFANLWVAQSYRNIGAANYCLGRYDEAFRCHELALRIRKTVLGEYHVLSSDSYENMGVVLRAKGDYQQALIYLQKALYIRIKLDKASKNSDRSLRLRVANSLYDIGSVCRDEGNYQEALKYHKEAYNIRKNYLFDPNNSLLVESEMAIKELELKLGFLQTL